MTQTAQLLKKLEGRGTTSRPSGGLLAEITAALTKLDAKERAEVEKHALEALADVKWVPNPGPQTQAFYSEADELFYGGQAGGGKSDLGLGLALTQHTRSLILRRFTDDAKALAERAMDIVGSRQGFNGQDLRLRVGDRMLDFGGCKEETDKQRYKGDPHDLIFFDEVPDFLLAQYAFISAWNRSVIAGQRCRIVCAGNPPTTADGLWVIEHWAAWLDPNHPNPAAPGELRWYVRGMLDGKELEMEVEGPGLYEVPGEQHPVRARSRTFIPAELSDNPDLAVTNYSAVLDNLPLELRQAYRDGIFSASLRDKPFQVIPSDWVAAAQKRWTANGGKDAVMSAMAVDPAGGGNDPAGFVCRHGGWFSEVRKVQGKITAEGPAMTAEVVKMRRDNCPVLLDVGGGYAGAMMTVLTDNGIPYSQFNGAENSTATAHGTGIRFFNKRAEIFWRLREALDPEQAGGCHIALPPSNELRSDLTALTWQLTKQGIKIISKEDLRKDLGRSTTEGDVVAMAYSEGNKVIERRLNGVLGNRAPAVVGGRVAQGYKRRHK